MYEFTLHPSNVPEAELAQFISARFPEGMLEMRAIETWTASGKKQSRLVERIWLSAEVLLGHFAYLRRLNREQRANIFFGVNPRTRAGHGTKQAVTHCRSVWMDMDRIRPHELQARLPVGLHEPSIVVDSGHGIHAYWLLDQPCDVSAPQSRARFETMLHNLYAAVGADATSDVSRLLRLPGFFNVKDFRHGKQPVACRLLHCDAEHTYPVQYFFDNWGKHREESTSRPTQQTTDLAGEKLRSGRTSRRIRGLVKYLDHETDDRSRRDFGVACALFRLGLSIEETRSLVASHSKFAGNKQYLEITLQNAQQTVADGG